MISPDIQQVFLLSDNFHAMGNALGDYIKQNKTKLSDDERNSLLDQQISLLQQAADINMSGTALVFDDIRQSLDQLDNITKEIEQSVKKALAVQNAINIATSIVELGNAILSKNPKEIGAKTIAAFKTIKG